MVGRAASGGGELDAGEATADDDEVGGLAPGRRVLEDDEAAEEPPHVAGAAQGEAVLAHAGHVLHRLAAARGDDELVVPQRLDLPAAGGADPDVGDELPAAVDLRDHAGDHGSVGHRVAERGAGDRVRQQAGEDLTGEPVEAVVVVGADDDELEPAAPDLAATATGQDLVCVEGGVPAADEDHPLTNVHATASSTRAVASPVRDAVRHPDRNTERGRRGHREPEVRVLAGEGSDHVDLVEVGDPDGEVPLVPGQGEERGLGEARIRPAVGQSDVAAADLQGRDRRRCRRRGSGRRAGRGRARSRCCAAASHRGRRRPRRGARTRGRNRPPR